MPLAVFVHSLTSEFGFYSSAESSIFTLPSIKLSEERQINTCAVEVINYYVSQNSRIIPALECQTYYPLAVFAGK
jgi:hypothetical protein